MRSDILYEQWKNESFNHGLREEISRLYTELVEFEGTIMPDYFAYARPTLAETIEELVLNIDMVILATCEGKCIGLLSVDKGQPTEIAGLYVQEEFRNQGIGKMMIDAFQHTNNHREITVVCFTANQAAIDFYKQIGFHFWPGNATVKGYRYADEAIKIQSV
jgi:ribosomal protein S18 acetylase RimI-like enzyme